jgi:type II secretory pathway component GspD/PulD (secretin)
VNADGLITMKIHPVVSRITSYIDGLPSVGSRESDSTIRVKEGETVVIGGLLQDEDINTMSKVPFLGDLPLVKELFRNRSTSHKKTEITIFITPKIMK